MKPLLSALLAIVLAAALCSCSTEKNADRWIANMREALTQRSQRARHPKSDDRLAELTAQIETEEMILGSAEDYSFTDSGLNDLADAYLDALQQEKAGLAAYGTEEYLELYIREGHYRRAAAVQEMAARYGLTVTGSGEADFRQLLDDCSAFAEDQAALDALKTIQPNAVQNADGSCKLTLHNPSQAELNNVTVTLGTDIRRSLAGWQAGADWEISLSPEEAGQLQEIVLRFVSRRTNLPWQTEPIAICADVAEPGVAFVLKNELPGDFTPDSWYHRVTCHVTDFHARLYESRDGKESWQLFLKGSKIYDVAGPENASMCHVDFRVTDEEGKEVFCSGTFYTPEILLDETFDHCIAFVPDLEPGTYYVELLDPAC